MNSKPLDNTEINALERHLSSLWASSVASSELEGEGVEAGTARPTMVVVPDEATKAAMEKRYPGHETIAITREEARRMIAK